MRRTLQKRKAISRHKRQERKMNSAPRLSRRNALTLGIGTVAIASCTNGPPLRPTTAEGDDAVREASLPHDAPTLYYVSAYDCIWCSKWISTSYPDFIKSGLRDRVRFVVLHSPRESAGPYADEAWPEDLRWLRAELLARNVRKVLPLFALVRGRSLVEAGSGMKGWEKIMLPAIQRATV